MEVVERPTLVKDKHLAYLDALRDSGITNMYGAVPYLMTAFKRMKRDDAVQVLSYWMRSFEERHSAKART